MAYNNHPPITRDNNIRKMGDKPRIYNLDNLQNTITVLYVYICIYIYCMR